MVRFDRILFPVDFSERCRGAARYVTAMAGRFQAELHLLHVLEPAPTTPQLDFSAYVFEPSPELRQRAAERMLRGFLDSDADHLNVVRHVTRNRAADAIIDYAHVNNMDLIMIPTHGYGPFRRFMLGSVTSKILHDAQCPVWTGVHMESAPSLEGISVKEIACAIDLNASAEAPLTLAADLASEYGCKLTVIHVVQASESVQEAAMDREFREILKQQARASLKARLDSLGIQAKICVEAGEIPHVVRHAAMHHEADLLLIGRGEHTGLGRLRTHSYPITREAPCPVISV